MFCKHLNGKSRFKSFLPSTKEICVFLLIIGGTSISLHFWALYTFPRLKTINRSRFGLDRVRMMIKSYNEENHRYPSSLYELNKYHTSINPDDDVWFLEVITNSIGVNKESDVLDGQGGWYYNNKTGEVRLNITKPIKHYWRFYWGQGRNDIPSDW